MLHHPISRLPLGLEPDRIDRDVGGPDEIEQLLEPYAAPRVAAIGVQQQNLAPILCECAIEIDAQRVVERRHPAGLLAAQAFNEPRKVGLAKSAHTHSGVKAHQGHVHSKIQFLEKLDGSSLREPGVALHAAARVEQHAEMERHGLEITVESAREICNILLTPLFLNHKVFGGQTGDRLPVLTHDGDPEMHKIDATPEYGLLLQRHRK